MDRTNHCEKSNSGHRFRFSVRTLLVVVTLSCTLIAIKRDWLLSFVEGRSLNLPSDFDFSPKHVLWSLPVGSTSYGSPVIAGDQIYVGTNNASGYLNRYPATVDLGVLMCIDRKTGNLLWQTATPKQNGRFDWPQHGQRGEPTIEKDRLWYINNRHELVCLDTNGFRDGEDDGVQIELSDKIDRSKYADIVWRYDIIREHGITPDDICHVDRGPSVCRVGDVLLCVTGHCQLHFAMDEPPVDAASFIAVNKNTGKLIWSDNSSSLGSKDSQTGTPVCANLGGVTQAIFPGGDGWLYSFDFKSLKAGKTKLLWKFDCNPKDASWGSRLDSDGVVGRLPILSQPLIENGYVYAATGTFSGGGQIQARLWCIDPTRRGDVSADLVFYKSDPTKPLPDKLPCACDPKAGDVIKPNPNSAAVWHFSGTKNLPFYSCRDKPLIRNGFLVAASDSGYVTCLDASSGKHLWTEDLLDLSGGAPVLSSDRVHCAHYGGITSFAISIDGSIADPKKVAPKTVVAPNFISATPAIADDTLYVLTDGRLYAIGKK